MSPSPHRGAAGGGDGGAAADADGGGVGVDGGAGDEADLDREARLQLRAQAVGLRQPPPRARAQAHSMGGGCKPWHGRPQRAPHQRTHAQARARACTPILDRRLGTAGSRRGWCVCLPGQGNMPRRREVLVSRGGGVRACAHACAPASHPLRGWWWWWRWRWRRPAAAGRGPECRRLNGRDPTKPRRQAAPLGTR